MTTALDALKAAQFALNAIPNYRFPHGEFRDSYAVASIVENAVSLVRAGNTAQPAMSKPDADSFTLRAEAATCLWEAMLDLRNDRGLTDQNAAKIRQLGEQWEKHGTVSMRHAAIALASVCTDAFSALTADEQESLTPYDWNFCPSFVLALDWRTDGGQPVVIPLLTDAVAMMKEAAKTAVAFQAVT